MYQKLLPILLILLSLPCAIANPLLEGFSAHYNVSRNGLALGGSKHQLVKQSNDTFLFTSTTEAEGFVALFVNDIITEQSTLTYRKNQFRPLKYTYRQTGGKKEKHIELVFDWQQHRLHHSAKPELKKLPANSQDLLSFQLAISNGLIKQQKQLEFTIIDHKRIQRHSLRVTGTETFPTSRGKLETVRLEQQNTKNNYRFSFWCAPKFHYLPVIIRKTEYDGDVITMQLRQFNGQSFQFENNNENSD